MVKTKKFSANTKKDAEELLKNILNSCSSFLEADGMKQGDKIVIHLADGNKLSYFIETYYKLVPDLSDEK